MASPMRIVYSNAADSATITASSIAGQMTPDRLQNDIKSDVWRSTGPVATLTLVWKSGVPVSCVALCYSNLSSQARMRVTAYDYFGALVADSSWQMACPPKAFSQLQWGREPLGLNAYPKGRAIGLIWLSSAVIVRRVVIEINDPCCALGYLEAGRLLVGDYWTLKRNFDYGHTVGIVDTATNFRTQAGDLLTDRGTKHRKQTLSLSTMPPADRERFWMMAINGGRSIPIFVSLYPNALNKQLEQRHTMYCKLVVDPVMTTPFFNSASATVELEEI